MANILLSYYSDYGESFYDAIADTLVKHGNNVYMLNINSTFVSITEWGGKSKLIDNDVIESIVDFNCNIILNFNYSLPYNIYNILKSDCKVCVLDADNPETFWNKQHLNKNKHKYYYLGFQSKSKTIYENYLDITLSDGNYVYFPPATGMFSQNIDMERNILFIGSNFYPYSIYEHSTFFNNDTKKFYQAIKNNFYLTKEDFKRICPNIPDKQIVWLYDKIKYFNAGQDRLKYLQQLTDLGLEIFGDRNWKYVEYYDIEIANCLNNKLIPNSLEDNLYLYNSSKISINISHPQAISSFSWRVMDIMASNSCLLMEEKQDWLDLFCDLLSKETIDAVIYKDRYDMRNKALALLNNEKLRLNCVRDLQNAIENNGRWENRIHILEKLLKLNLKNQGKGSKYIYKIPNDEKIKIYAIINQPATHMYDTLYYETSKNSLFEWTFVLIPFKDQFADISMDTLETMMNNKKYPYIKGYLEEQDCYVDLRLMYPDIVLIQTPYDLHRISPLYSVEYFSSFAFCYCISMGFNPFDNNQKQYYHYFPTQNKSCDMLYESNTYYYSNKNFNQGEGIVVGNLRCDKFINYTNKDMHFIPRPDYDFIIVWHPSFIGTIGYSNFITYFHYFMDYAQNNKNNLLYILLDYSLKHMMVDENHIFTEDVYDSYIDRLKSIDNIIILDSFNYQDYIFHSDVFIGDNSSVMFDYLLTSKPIILTETSIKLNSYGMSAKKYFYSAKNEDEITNLISMLKTPNNDYLKEERWNNLSLIHYKKDGLSAAKYCLDYFNKLDFTKLIKKRRSYNNSIIKSQPVLLEYIKNKIKNVLWKYKILYPLYVLSKKIWHIIK